MSLLYILSGEQVLEFTISRNYILKCNAARVRERKDPGPYGLIVGNDISKRLALTSVLTSYFISVNSNYAYVLVSKTKEQELWQLTKSI